MSLPVGWALVLIVAAVWNLLVWPPFWRRVAKDPRARDDAGRPTRFFTVHAVLVGVSMLLAVLVGVVGVLGLGG
ncbi:SCO4848 family membrane protein [Isoptericola sp. NPDC057191]|uniref:SCO4848 family membrane protein n=1 Tax=Isoptericola sp. NPDC057191 TaxID=3346041 RepID=UPI003637D2B4